MGSISFFSVFIFLGVFQGFFLAIFLFVNKRSDNSLVNKTFGSFLIVLAFVVLRSFILYSGIKIPSNKLLDLFPPLDYLIGPFYYFFLFSWMKKRMPRYFYLHLAPFFLSILYIILPILTLAKYHVPISVIHILIYIVIVIVLYFNYFKGVKQSNLRIISKENQKILISLIIFAIFSIASLLTRFIFPAKPADIAIISYMTTLFYLLTFLMLMESNFFHSLGKKRKYEKSALSQKSKNEIFSRIMITMENKPYLKTSFTLDELAKMVGGTPHHISQVINECMRMTFLQLIARRRIEEAQRLLLTSKGNERTVLNIAEAVGYISKSAFNTAFKKITGLSPSQYREKALK